MITDVFMLWKDCPETWRPGIAHPVTGMAENATYGYDGVV